MIIRRPNVTAFQSSLLLTASACGFAHFLSGCGAVGGFPNTPSEGETLVLTGNVQGGQQPVSGSHVHVMQAASSAYGAASKALMTANGTTILSDSIGPYIASDSGGNFSVTGDYTCTAGAQVYLLATQGNPGMTAGTNNTGIGIMAGLGVCPASGTFATTSPTVIMNEVTTVATAYALAGFFTDSTHLATDGSAGATIGINNAGANIAQLVSIGTGQTLAATPNGQGTVPQAELNVLGDILSYCINSNGSNCSSLLSLTPNGSTVPTETATAAINIAHNPGANVSALFNLAPSSAPFQPTPSSAPYDFSITIQYTPSTPIFASSGGGSIAIDASGDVWGPGAGSTSVIELSPLGAVTQTISFSAGNTNNPLKVTVSPAGTIWVANSASGFAQPTDGSFNKPAATAVDQSGNIWVANSGNNTVAVLTQTGSPAIGAPLSGNGLATPVAVAIDASANAWVANSTGATLSAFTVAGAPMSGSPFAPNGLSQPVSLAFDAIGNIWLANSGNDSVLELSNIGTPIQQISSATAPSAIVINPK